jgi:hypothetical protein
MKVFLFVLVMWPVTIGSALPVARVWWTAVRTGRWLLGGGRTYNSPGKHMFSVYDRTNNPYIYRLAVTSSGMLLLYLLLQGVLLTVLSVHFLLGLT